MGSEENKGGIGEYEKEKIEKTNKASAKYKIIKIIIACIVLELSLAFGLGIIQNILIKKENAETPHSNGGTIIFAKPIIYLYPTETKEIIVKLGNAEALTCFYPVYNDEGWTVLAEPDGNLTDLSTGKHLYSLYYESESESDLRIENEGFCVSKEDTASFLEKKLAVLGLSEREAEEFIIYWLPKLQENEYNYIRFATIDEINKNMPLEFSVEPDTLIRVLMTYKGLDEPIDVEEQQLETPERTGFVVVEWGGTEIVK